MVGCKKDLLESTPYSQSTSNTFWRNGTDAVSASNALYSLLGDEGLFPHTEQTWDICSDDQWRAGDHGEDQAIEEFTFDASNPQLGFSWSLKYEIISRANAILINVPKIEIIKGVEEMNLDMIDGSYDYLLRMPIYSLTKEVFDKLKEDFASKKEEIEKLKLVDPKDMYLDDLSDLKKRMK